VSRTRRRALLYSVAVLAGAALLFAGYGITVPPDTATQLHGAAFLAGLGQTDQALEACDKVLREEPGSLDARVYRATFLSMAGRQDEALLAFEDAIAHASDKDVKCDLILDRASILLQAGRTQEFEAERQRLATLGAGYRLDLCEGLKAEKEGAWGAAVDAYGRAAKARPGDEQVTGRLHVALLEQGREALAAGRFDDARRSIDRAVELLPRAQEARLRAAEVRLVTGDLDGAIAQLREAGPKARGAAPLIFRAATALLRDRRREEALDALAAALQCDRAVTEPLLRNEALWRDEIGKPDVQELLETERRSTPPSLTGGGGVIDDRRNSGEPGPAAH
jgi:tetratricopeptide (TPR) repeat protein